MRAMSHPAVVAPPDFLTLDEAAAVLRVGRSTAYREANKFEASGGATGIPVIRYGKQFRVPRCRLEEQLGGPITWPLPSDAPVIVATTRPSRPRKRAARAVASRSTPSSRSRSSPEVPPMTTTRLTYPVKNRQVPADRGARCCG